MVKPFDWTGGCDIPGLDGGSPQHRGYISYSARIMLCKETR